MGRAPTGRRYGAPSLASLRARLANRPDSEHEQATVRIVIVLILAAYYGALALSQPDGARGFLGGALFACGYAAASLGYLAWIFVQPGVCRLRRLLAMATDHTTLSVLLALGGPWGGALYPIYLWVTFGNGFRYGNAYLAASGGFTVPAFVMAAWFNPFWHAHIALTAGLAIGLVALPGYVASLIRKLTEAKRSAEAANRAKSRFLATMSHELRTPLNAVIGLADLLDRGRLEAEQRDMVRTIDSSGRALLALINDILDLAKIESGKEDVQAGDFDLVAELASVVAIVRPQAQGKGLKAGLVVDAGVPTRIRGDVRHLRQVLLNLLSNAVKFTDGGGVLVQAALHTVDQREWLRVRVEDTGIGVSEDDRERIFEAFTQSEADTSRRHQGTGLGLTIARQLVGLMGGRLWVESTPGQGSTFAFDLPVERARAEAVSVPRLEATVRVVAPGSGGSDDLATMIAAAGAAVRSADADGQIVVFDLRDAVPGQMPEARLLDSFVRSAAIARGCIIVAPDAARVIQPLAWASGAAVRIASRPDVDLMRQALDLTGVLAWRKSPDNAIPDDWRIDGARVGAKVLVVEDNAVNAKVTAKILERGGHKPVVVTSGDAALERLDAGDIDAVLMDVNMPGENGIDTAKLLRFTEFGGKHRLPIIALTADATVDTREACFEAGMDDYLTKPIDAAKLLRVLSQHLPGSASVEEPTSSSTAAGAAPATVGEPVIDSVAVRTLLDLDAGGAFLLEVADNFYSDAGGLLNQIEEAVAKDGSARAGDLLHALGSAAGYVGALRVRVRAKRLERDLSIKGTKISGDELAAFRRDIDDYRTAATSFGPAPDTQAPDTIELGARVVSLPRSAR